MTKGTLGPLLEVRQLRYEYPLRRGILQRPAGVVRAVDDVSFELWSGETLGLVGESGCGKTTLGKAILRLLEPTAGEVILHACENGGAVSRSLLQLPPSSLRRHLQIVFQNPFASLNPRLTVGASIAEGLHAAGPRGTAHCRARVRELLGRVGLNADAAGELPRALSGGQLQRVCIARAIAAEPSLVVCDEVTSALDVSVQAQVINLLVDLQQERGMAFLFISHDLKLVAQISRRVAVMQGGRFVQVGLVSEVFTAPRHPYTRRLLAAVTKRAQSVGGEGPDGRDPAA